jgi:bleomycin hydrolase
MGVNQSKSQIPNEKLVIERLRALQAKDQADSEYVQVDEKVWKGASSHFKAPWTALSTTELEHWEHELLTDPKNRYAFLFNIIQLRC